MTKEEFIKQFKVGDTIRCSTRIDPLKITAIGEQMFLGYDSGMFECTYGFNRDWQKYTHKKKRPLPSEEIEEIFKRKSTGSEKIIADHNIVFIKSICEWLDENWNK